MKLLERKEAPKHGTAILWTSRTISLYFAWAVIAQVTYFCTDYLGLNAGIIGSIMLFSKVADCISNFLIANYIDNGSSKWGKVRQHEVHIVLLWIDVALMFMIPKGLGNLTKYILIFLLYTLNCAVFQTFLNCTDAIYLRRAFKDDNQRTVVQTVSGGVGMVAMYLGVMLMPLMIDYFEDIPGGWTMMVLICAVPMAIIGSIRFFLFPEVEDVQEVTKENRSSILETLKTFVTNKYVLLVTMIYFCVQLQSNMQSTPSTYYFTYVVGNLSLMSVVTLFGYIAALALFVVVPMCKKFGRSNVIRFFGLVCVIGCAMRWFAGSNLVLLSVSNILASFVNYAWMAIGPLMLIDVMTYGEWKNGKLAEGAVFAATGLGNTLGAGVGAALSGIVLGIFGYDGTLEVQSASAILGIKVCYAVIPTILMLVAFVLFMAYNLEKKMPQINADLEVRHQAVSATATINGGPSMAAEVEDDSPKTSGKKK